MPNYLSNYYMDYPEYIDPNRYLNYGIAAQYMDFGSDAGNSLGSALMSGVKGYLSSGNLIGAVAGAGMNLFNQYRQNQQTEDYYNRYLTPEARMKLMQQAGINPNAAARGIAGSNASPIQGASANDAVGVADKTSELLANSPKTAAEIENMQANTNSVKLDNAIKAKELGNWDEYRRMEIEQMQSDIASKMQAVEESKELVKKYKEEVTNLKQEYNNLVVEEGEIVARKKLEEANARLSDAEAQLKRLTAQVGVAPGSPEYAYRKACLDFGMDSPQAKAELDKLYKTTNAAARGQYDSDPGHQTFRESKDAIVYLQEQKSEINRIVDSLKSEYMKTDDEEKSREIFIEIQKYKRMRGECDNAIKNADKAFKKESYKNGFHTQWQNSVDAIVKGVSTGIGIGIGAVGTQAVGAAYGSSKAAFGKAQYEKGYYQGSNYSY